ncbi:MAG TPA: GTP 3',8-cyclase MoaA [Pirellulales bacterium]|jgi:cyclic pyranopterin phosphate synthase|nr:GTP 3',8-cyclase MoaA [Pirellulales bacterium]
MLVDSFGRIHNSLRISVTDRCNLRCFYCMPMENVQFLPREELLTFEEITRFVQALVKLGIDKLRLTGGEPLLRNELPTLVKMLASVPGIRDIALTTNGLLLTEQAGALRAAGLQRLNISLDALSEAAFQQIARRKGLQRVLDGIYAAQQAGFRNIRLNAVSIRGITEEEIVPLACFARQQKLELRFIEYMPLDAEHHWNHDQLLSGAEVREIIEREVGNLEPLPVVDPSQPATDFRYVDEGGRVGFINPVSEPFCGSCNRLRLTAEGQVRNCLFSTIEWDARALLRRGAGDEELVALVAACVQAKKPGHGIDTPDFVQPQRAMYQIGG